MARVLPLVLLVLPALSPGGGPAPTLARGCNAADFILKEREKEVIVDKQDKGSDSIFNPYVKPQPGFEGLRLVVMGINDTSHDAFFPAEPDCFPNSDTWYQVGTRALISSDTHAITFRFRINECARQCKVNSSSPHFQNFSVVAYGPSRWLLDSPPDSCDTIDWTLSPYPSTPTCSKPPLPTTPTTPLPLTVVTALSVMAAVPVPLVALVAVAVAMVLLLLTVMVLVAGLLTRRRQQQHPTTSSE